MAVAQSPSTRVLRVLSAGATGTTLTLRGDVQDRLPAGSAPPPTTLVLSAAGTDRELRIALVPDGDGVSGTVDVRSLVIAPGATVWTVRAARDTAGADEECDVVSFLDAAA